MQIWNGWLYIMDGDIVELLLDFNSIKEVHKHYVSKSRRSFLHHYENCAFCLAGFPLSRRFIARVICDGNNLHWEYGAIVQEQVLRLGENVHESGFLRLSVRREGKGRTTFYRCSSADPDSPGDDSPSCNSGLDYRFCPDCFKVLPQHWTLNLPENRKCRCSSTKHPLMYTTDK